MPRIEKNVPVEAYRAPAQEVINKEVTGRTSTGLRVKAVPFTQSMAALLLAFNVAGAKAQTDATHDPTHYVDQFQWRVTIISFSVTLAVISVVIFCFSLGAACASARDQRQLERRLDNMKDRLDTLRSIMQAEQFSSREAPPPPYTDASLPPPPSQIPGSADPILLELLEECDRRREIIQQNEDSRTVYSVLSNNSSDT